MKKVLFIVLFLSTHISAKQEPKYTSSTITKDCQQANVSECKQKATQSKEFIFAYKKARKIYKNLNPKDLFKKCYASAAKK